MRDHVLHFRGMLRGTPDMHAEIFFRHSIGNLPLQIELFLTANGKLTVDASG